MAGHTPWSQIRFKRPIDPFASARIAFELDREYHRLRWRIVRVWDRLRGR